MARITSILLLSSALAVTFARKHSDEPTRSLTLSEHDFPEADQWASDNEKRAQQHACTGAEDQIFRVKGLAARFRRDIDDEVAECSSTKDDSIVPQAIDLVKQETRGHTFPDSYGSLFISWARDSMGEMIAVTAQPRKRPDAPFASAMYVSLDGGKIFHSPPSVTKTIKSADFSSVPRSNDHYNALAFPTDYFSGNYFSSSDSAATWVETPTPSSWATSSPCYMVADGLKTPTRDELITLESFSFSPASPHHVVVMGRSSNNYSRGYCPYFIDIDGSDPTLLLPSGVGFADSIDWQQPTNATTNFATIYLLTETGSLYSILTTKSGLGATSLVPAYSGIQGFTIINEFIFLEQQAVKGDTEFDHIELIVGSGYGESVQYGTARLPVDKDHTTNRFEVLDADEDEVMLMAQHTAVEPSGVVNVEATLANGTLLGLFNASRAIFSEILATSKKAQSGRKLVFDSVNPLACEDHFVKRAGEVLVVFRGTCTFASKIQHAKDSNASAVIIINYPYLSHAISMTAPEGVDTDAFSEVPAVMITRKAGCALLGLDTIACKYQKLIEPNNLNVTEVNVTVALWEDDVQASEKYFYSQLYTSGNRGIDFSLSLRNIRVISRGDIDYVDLYEIKSMEGAYLANVQKGSDIVTIISHNKGATWERTYDENGDSVTLTLVADSAVYGYPGPASVSTAPGLVIANAKAENTTTSSLYISRDGGLTWRHSIPKHTAPSMYSFQILDHGSVTVFTRYRQMQSAVYFSLDEGATMEQLALVGLGGLSGSWISVNDGSSCGTELDYSNETVICEAGSVVGDLGCNRTNNVLLTVAPDDKVLLFNDLKGTCYTDAAGTKSVPCTQGGVLKIVWTKAGTSSKSCWARSDNEVSKSILGNIADVRSTGTSVFMYWFDREPAWSITGDWVGVRIDFSAAFLAYHTDGNTACTDDDFEMWQPEDSVDQLVSGCDMGVQRLVSRHKQCSVCYNGPDHTTDVSTKACACVNEDYACNFGYRRLHNAQADKEATGVELCTLDSTYTPKDLATKKTRLVPGDQCTDGSVLPSDDGVTTTTSSNVGAIVGGAVGGVVVLALVIFFVRRGCKSKGNAARYDIVNNNDGSINADADDDADDDDEMLITVDDPGTVDDDDDIQA